LHPTRFNTAHRCRRPSQDALWATCLGGARQAEASSIRPFTRQGLLHLSAVVLLTAVPRAAAAQLPASTTNWVRESWSIADGLPVNSVNALLQSKDGYIWAATFDGLVRFDGVRFTVFNTANSPGLPSDRIISILETKDGTLWLNTEQRFLVHFARGRFTGIDKSRGIDGSVWAIAEDTAGTLWVATERGVGVIRDNRFERVAADAIIGDALSLAASRDGGMWVGTRGNGVFKVGTGTVQRVSRGVAIDTADVQTMYEDSEGRLWVSAASSGLVAVYRLPRPATRGAVERWPSRSIQRFVEVPSTRVVLGYSTGGVDRFDPGGRLTPLLRQPADFTYAAPLQLHGTDSVWATLGRQLWLNERLVYTLEATLGASAGAITDMLLDREGGIWLGTQRLGLQRLRRNLFTVYGAAEGLGARNAYVVARDANDAIWVGSNVNGLSRMAPDRQSIRNVDRQTIRFVGSLLADGPDRLLVGTEAGLRSCVVPTLKCSRSVLPPLDPLRNWGGVFALHRTADGRVLAGTFRDVFERRNGQWRRLAGWTTPSPARAFADGRDGALWIGTNGSGVVRCTDGRCRTLTIADGLPSNIIRSLHVDADGWLWIGTEGRGLARLDARSWPDKDDAHTPKIVAIGVADGLYDPVVHQMLDDGLGRLWMSSNRGIFWVTRANLLAFADGRATRIRSTAYTERDGLRDREANGGFQPAGMRGRDGLLWFPTQEGVVSIDPARIPIEQAPPPVVVEQLVARGRVVSADSALMLGATERDLEISYTALTFREPRNVRFRYRLEPYDTSWVDAGSRRTAFYTRVPPGRYTFRVAASQGGDTWSVQAATLELRVAPLFRETAMAKVLLALSLLLGGALAVRWRLQALRQREVDLTALVQERTAALQRNEAELAAQNTKLEQLNQARSRLFANLSHEFRTPLTLILGPLRSLLDGRHGTLGPSAREQGGLMLRNGQRLLRLINQVLDLARLQAGAVDIARQPLELVSFVRTMTQAFTPLADRQSIAVVFRSPVRALTVNADPEQVEKVLLNLLSNAVKFTRPGGIVDVSVVMDNAHAVIAVRDTGVGISADDLPHVFERFYQAESDATRRYDGTGIGLALAKELVELHGGVISATSTIGEGSTFTVRLPIGTASAATSSSSIPRTETLDELLGENPLDTADTIPQEESADDRLTVLLVDDNTDVRAYVRSVLAPRFHVLEAVNGRAGLNLAREALPDLIVADVMMPELDGLGLGRALKADPMTDAIPVVLLTARAAAEDQIAGLAAGADAYLVKPFDPGVLTACVENLLTQRRRLRERFRQGEVAPPESAPAAPSPLDLRLRPLVQARLLDPEFSAEALAAAAGLSYHQLYRALRDELNSTPSRYIRTVRAECAAELLRQGAGSVTEVAYAVGFESLSYFRRAFRERFDQTPSDFLTAEPGASPRL
jgi:signal transduction histidine kinase/CheY-like chemotaxis protein